MILLVFNPRFSRKNFGVVLNMC